MYFAGPGDATDSGKFLTQVEFHRLGAPDDAWNSPEEPACRIRFRRDVLVTSIFGGTRWSGPMTTD